MEQETRHHLELEDRNLYTEEDEVGDERLKQVLAFNSERS